MCGFTGHSGKHACWLCNRLGVKLRGMAWPFEGDDDTGVGEPRAWQDLAVQAKQYRDARSASQRKAISNASGLTGYSPLW